jgi:uncharacterized protein (DUF433 family)
MMNDKECLIEQYIEQDPSRPGRYNARLKDYGVHVWALISYLQVVDWDVERTAHDYDVPREAVEAALAYYREHKDIIDARIEANNTLDDGWVPVNLGTA